MNFNTSFKALPLEVKFDPEKGGIYFTGDYINGKIILNNPNYPSIREIFVTVEGKMRVQWEEIETRNQFGFLDYVVQSYKNEKTFLATQQNLLNEVMLHPGKNVYDFRLEVPKSIPSSCSINSSFIKYDMSIVVHDVVDFHKLKTIPLTIRRRLHNDLRDKLQKPTTINFTKKLWFWPCRAQPFTASVGLNSLIFSPGCDLGYTINMDNPSNYFCVKNILVLLFRFVHYTSTTPRVKQKRDIRSIVLNSHEKPCGYNATKTITDHVKLPETLLNTSIDQCAIMISYELQVIIDMGILQSQSKMSVPITIAHYNDINEKKGLNKVDTSVKRDAESDVHVRIGDVVVSESKLYKEMKNKEFCV